MVRSGLTRGTVESGKMVGGELGEVFFQLKLLALHYTITNLLGDGLVAMNSPCIIPSTYASPNSV